MFLNIGFSHDWWYQKYGFVFDESFYLNAANKIRTMNAMDEIMQERFPYYTSPGGLKDSVVSNPTIAVEPFGHRFIPALFGCEINYSKDTTPWARHTDLSDDVIMNMPFLTPGEFSEDNKVQTITRQAAEMQALGYECSAQQNTGSVINSAIYLRENLFTDFYEKPEVIHRLFDLITNRMECSLQYFAGVDGGACDIGIGNCCVCMLSPSVYETFNRPCDDRIMKLAQKMGVRFSVHQDSDVTPYIGCYEPFDYLYSFDVGQDTELELFRRAFPDVIMNIFVYSVWLLENDIPEITQGIKDMISKAGSPELTGVSCYDIDARTSDEKIKALCDACL
jgi:hypothetical protein